MGKESFRSALACLCLLTATLSARAAEVFSYELDNGMEVVVLEDRRAPIVVHMVWYRAGAADEPPGRSGVAHFLEHLMFKGTDDLASGEFSRIVASNGGEDNAFTSQDYTAYFQKVAADRLELMMRMEADRMRNLRVSEREALTERDVILEERNQRFDNEPSALFGEQRSAAQYMNHPYGIPLIGWRREMERLSLDDAMAFYRRFYAPNHAILIVAGDVDPNQVRQLADRYYGPLEPTDGLGERDRPQEPPQLAERRLTMEDPRVSQPVLIRTYLAAERDPGAQEEAAALEILARLLGGGAATSALGRKLQFEERKALHVSAFYNGTSLDDTTLGIYVLPASDVGLAEAEEALDRALAEFREEGVDPEDLARVKMQIAAALIYGEDDIQGLARRYGRALTSGLTLADIDAWPEILAAVTAEDILNAADRTLDRRNAVTGWLMVQETGEESSR